MKKTIEKLDVKDKSGQKVVKISFSDTMITKSQIKTELKKLSKALEKKGTQGHIFW